LGSRLDRAVRAGRQRRNEVDPLARAKSSMKNPRLTPLRAFELLRDLDVARGREGPGTSVAEDRARDALASHVRNALVRAGSR
jgi:hypothetical protein